MAPASDLPMALWQANLDLQLRIARLLQDNGREWLDMGIRAVGEGAFEFNAETRALWRSGDWQALAALPVETLWRQLEQRVGDGQALAQVALNAQDAFAGGLASALQDWQAQVTRALVDAGAGETSPFGHWQAAFAPWREALAQAAALKAVPEAAPDAPAPSRRKTSAAGASKQAKSKRTPKRGG